MLISGALHGDERIGPVTAMALSQWLIERYDSDPWVRRLVDTRTVLIMPMTNAIGVEQRRRDELGVDPNRDFPYDQSPNACMATICARSLNELYRAPAAARRHLPWRHAGDRLQLGLVQLLQDEAAPQPRRHVAARDRVADEPLRRHRRQPHATATTPSPR